MTKLAALDLGSNSFHLLDAVLVEGNAEVIAQQKSSLIYGCRLKEKVQLGAGLDADHNLSQVSINRGLECIKNFHRYIEEQNVKHLIAVATNTLRVANNSSDFIRAAESILNTPIKVISGKEEARLIFSAVINEITVNEMTNDQIADLDSGLVIDIGGGSTEFAIGNHSKLHLTESLEMGCVSYYQRFFADGKIYSENVKAAEKAARLEIEPHLEQLFAFPKSWIVGTSGTFQSIAILANRLFNDDVNSLSLASLDALDKIIIDTGHIKALDFEYLDSNRRAILPAGIAIVRAIFDCLNIDKIRICQTALCEGLLMQLEHQINNSSKSNI
ncbi:MAG: exopolyphosphatase/guanosine-5'-triphosphate,3'-diphosphate pyrophosphatase [Enterobacterales bacterium]|jgi:exopolyphosphatase/guanosine-5'-triphosphate,3'-diphosphate pyrophosphatase